MTTTLIVLAHPERRSFNGTWAEATEAACVALGHSVLWSDLGAMRFAPAEGAQHYPCHPAGTRFDPLKAQEAAADAQALPADVQGEIDKIRAADRMILHFPI